MRVLLVEDDALLGDGIQAGLKLADYAVDWVRDGGQPASPCSITSTTLACWTWAAERTASPSSDLRGRGNATPVLVLTARDTHADKIAGLDAGADDYLTKPFDLGELWGPPAGADRRASGGQSDLEHGEVRLEPAAKRVTKTARRSRCRRVNMRCCMT